MSTLPLGNKVAVWPFLATLILPVAVNFLALGSYSSALAFFWVSSFQPPAMSTSPFGNNVAVWLYLVTLAKATGEERVDGGAPICLKEARAGPAEQGLTDDRIGCAFPEFAIPAEPAGAHLVEHVNRLVE